MKSKHCDVRVFWQSLPTAAPGMVHKVILCIYLEITAPVKHWRVHSRTVVGHKTMCTATTVVVIAKYIVLCVSATIIQWECSDYGARSLLCERTL